MFKWDPAGPGANPESGVPQKKKNHFVTKTNQNIKGVNRARRNLGGGDDQKEVVVKSFCGKRWLPGRKVWHCRGARGATKKKRWKVEPDQQNTKGFASQNGGLTRKKLPSV